MEQREIDAIGMSLWKEELERRKDPAFAHDVKLNQAFFDEVNALKLTKPMVSGLGKGYCWHMQFSPKNFTAEDKAIVPIVLKYLDRFENKGLKNHYIRNCLAVKGFYDATEYLIAESKKHLPPNYDDMRLNATMQTLMHIRDPRYIDEYIWFIQKENAVTQSSYIVELLGLLRAKKAIPYIIELLDGEKVKNEGAHILLAESAIIALGRFKDPQYIPLVEKFLKPEEIRWIKVKVDNPDTKEGKWELRYRTKEVYRDYTKAAEKAIKRMKG